MASGYLDRSGNLGKTVAAVPSFLNFRSPDLIEPALAILDCLEVGLILFDKALVIEAANPAAGKLLLLHRTVDATLDAGCAADDAGSWGAHLGAVFAGDGVLELPSVDYKLGDSLRHLRLAGRKVLLGGQVHGLLSVVDIGPVSARDAGPVTTVDIRHGTIKKTGFPSVGDVGSASAVDNGSAIASRAQAAQQARLAAVGEMTCKIAHELNSPIDGILRYINLALRVVQAEGLTKVAEYLEHCREGLTRMVGIIGELLGYVRGPAAGYGPAELQQLLNEALRSVQGRAEAAGVRIVTEFQLKRVKVRSTELYQVFCNLANNAIDAMPTGGELQVRVSSRQPGLAEVAFRDCGAGFDPEQTEKLFEPFYTTKDRGTGLGLAICKEIVERHGGKIEVQSSPGAGSVFTVHVPVVEAPDDEA